MKTNKKRKNKEKGKKENERKIIMLSTQPIFANDFSHVAQLFLFQNSAQHKPFTILKLCQLLNAIF